MLSNSFAVVTASLATAAWAGSLKDIKHVVLFMQENRAFDHYFGTMAGVRGFADPNVQVNPDGLNTFQQLVTPAESNGTTILMPWYLNYLGGDWRDATQCMGAGDNSWQAMHAAYNGGLVNQWVATNTPWNWGYFRREDIPVHFDIAEGWTVADMYQESVMAATDPNRVVWLSGTVNNPGTPNNPDGEGDMILDNNAIPGCEEPHLNCFPFTWKTFPEYLEEAGVTWQVYQDFDNFEDNMLAYFAQYQNANDTSPLTIRGNSYPGLAKFYADAKKGTLPQVSYIIGPAELSEHSPYLPSDGAWLQKQVVDAVINSPIYNETVLMISYDEVGGFGDHVAPYHAPNGTAGEWIEDPYGSAGYTPIGPGFRIPFYIISPWTRGGRVFTEHADHTSQILFLEAWLEALGYKGVHSKEIPPWRREHMSNLVNAFDFDTPDYSFPRIAAAIPPLTVTLNSSEYSGNLSLGSLTGNYIGAAKCQAQFPQTQPPVPYGPANANANLTLLMEEGFKPVRGALTEGRYLTFEADGLALANQDGKTVTVTPATAQHDDIRQRWIIHEIEAGGNEFTIQSAVDRQYIASSFPPKLTNSSDAAQAFTVIYEKNGLYRLQVGANSTYLSVQKGVQYGNKMSTFEIFSVTYH